MAKRRAIAETAQEVDDASPEEQDEVEAPEEDQAVEEDAGEVEPIRPARHQGAPASAQGGGGLHLILSADQVADQLGAERAEVVELMRRGIIPAKKMGSDLYTTVDQVVAYFRKADRPDTLDRYREGDTVVVLEGEESVVFGYFKAEQEDGRIVVSVPHLFGTADEVYHPSQVQPLTARLPRASRH